MEKNWNAMEKLWKSYGISFLEICTNPVSRFPLFPLKLLTFVVAGMFLSRFPLFPLKLLTFVVAGMFLSQVPLFPSKLLRFVMAGMLVSHFPLFCLKLISNNFNFITPNIIYIVL